MFTSLALVFAESFTDIFQYYFFKMTKIGKQAIFEMFWTDFSIWTLLWCLCKIIICSSLVNIPQQSRNTGWNETYISLKEISSLRSVNYETFLHQTKRVSEISPQITWLHPTFELQFFIVTVSYQIFNFEFFYFYLVLTCINK